MQLVESFIYLWRSMVIGIYLKLTVITDQVEIVDVSPVQVGSRIACLL